VTYAIMKDGVQVGAATVELGDDFIINPVDTGPVVLS
jgi:hypothetical protein